MSQRVIDMTDEQLRALIADAVRAELDARERATTAKYLTAEDVAGILRVHPKVVVRWVEKRGLPGRKVGRDWRFSRAELEKWIAEQGGDPKKGKAA